MCGYEDVCVRVGGGRSGEEWGRVRLATFTFSDDDAKLLIKKTRRIVIMSSIGVMFR